MPYPKGNGPQPITGDRPDATSAITTASLSPKSPARQPAQRDREPVAYVSLLWPAGRRTCWWYLVRCRDCGLPHLGRARELADVTRTRRLPCGHWVTIMIARTYGRPDSRDAA